MIMNPKSIHRTTCQMSLLGSDGQTMSNAQRIEPSKVREGLRSKIVGYPILYFRKLPSTNDVAKELALQGINEGAVVVAETQTKGRGRLERKWISPEGGLWLSIVFRPKTTPKYAPMLTLLSSVAVAKTISKEFRLRTEIKWPNDVLVNMKKISGILTESRTTGEIVDFIVVGIGVNANFDIDALPAHLKYSSTTLKEELGREIEREILLRRLLELTESYYKFFQEGQFGHILGDWRGLACFLGSRVEVEGDREKIEGQAVDIDADGALVLTLRDGTTRRVLSGDLRILGRAELR